MLSSLLSPKTVVDRKDPGWSELVSFQSEVLDSPGSSILFTNKQLVDCQTSLTEIVSLAAVNTSYCSTSEVLARMTCELVSASPLIWRDNGDAKPVRFVLHT